MTLLLAAFLMLQAAAAPGSLSGTVILKDTAMQTPLASARVELSGGPGLPLVVRTDSLGRLRIAHHEPRLRTQGGELAAHPPTDEPGRSEHHDPLAGQSAPGQGFRLARGHRAGTLDGIGAPGAIGPATMR